MTSLDVVVGLGANLGAPLEQLRAARLQIEALAQVTAASSLYETEPVGPPQPSFLNAALRLWWSGDPFALLEALLGVEREAGRVRRERWGPRVLDLDILWSAGVRLDAPDLQVPHPRLVERAFALVPLVEVAPDACDPDTGRPYAEILAGLDRGPVRRLPSLVVSPLDSRTARW